MQNVIDKFRETIHKFIEWICVNFDIGTGDTLIRDFERETRTCLDGEEQMLMSIEKCTILTKL